MEVKIENLIEKIKSEGIEKANDEANNIISEAKSQSEIIINEAKKKADKIIADGKHQVDQYKKTAEDELKQISRDMVLHLKAKIIHIIENLLKKELTGTLDPQFLYKLITDIILQWIKNEHVDIVLAEKDLQQLESLLISQFKEETHKGINLKINTDMTSGFMIKKKDGDISYDFTAEAISDYLKKQLSPRLREILG